MYLDQLIASTIPRILQFMKDIVMKMCMVTPDLCTNCWTFFDSFLNERNCGITLVETTSSVSSDCIGVTVPLNDIINYT